MSLSCKFFLMHFPLSRSYRNTRTPIQVTTPHPLCRSRPRYFLHRRMQTTLCSFLRKKLRMFSDAHTHTHTHTQVCCFLSCGLAIRHQRKGQRHLCRYKYNTRIHTHTNETNRHIHTHTHTRTHTYTHAHTTHRHSIMGIRRPSHPRVVCNANVCVDDNIR